MRSTGERLLRAVGAVVRRVLFGDGRKRFLGKDGFLSEG